MKTHPLPQLQEWEQFDDFVVCLQRLGWRATEGGSGIDARSWAFERGGESLWLVFDDLMGGSLKSENTEMNLKAIAAELEATLHQ